jgi:hypothetical protein
VSTLLFEEHTVGANDVVRNSVSDEYHIGKLLLPWRSDNSSYFDQAATSQIFSLLKLTRDNPIFIVSFGVLDSETVADIDNSIDNRERHRWATSVLLIYSAYDTASLGRRSLGMSILP